MNMMKYFTLIALAQPIKFLQLLREVVKDLEISKESEI